MGSKTMLPSESAETLERFLSDQGIGGELTDLNRVVTAILEFYATIRASGLNPDPDSDMLLFQYGVFDWGEGEFFELDITRQFIAAGQEDDDAISQLRCTTKFESTTELRSIQSWNIWCQKPADLTEFREGIFASRGYQAALMAKPVQREILWGLV